LRELKRTRIGEKKEGEAGRKDITEDENLRRRYSSKLMTMAIGSAMMIKRTLYFKFIRTR